MRAPGSEASVIRARAGNPAKCSATWLAKPDAAFSKAAASMSSRPRIEAGAEHALAVRQHRQVLRLGDVVHREERLEHGARRVVFLPIQGRRDADERSVQSRGPVAGR